MSIRSEKERLFHAANEAFDSLKSQSELMIETAFATLGPSPLWDLLENLGSSFSKDVGVVLTDRRVFLLPVSWRGAIDNRHMAVASRADVHVTRKRRVLRWTSVWITWPGGRPKRLNFNKVWEAEGSRLVDALGTQAQA